MACKIVSLTVPVAAANDVTTVIDGGGIGWKGSNVNMIKS